MTITSQRARTRLLAGTCCLFPLLFTNGATSAAEQTTLSGPSADTHARLLEEVIVTAPPVDEPLTISTDPKAARQPVPPADGAGYLKQIPGFSVTRKGGIGGDPLLRGQGGSRLNILLDDTPLAGGCGARMDPPTAYVFPESYDRITVIKGPQTVEFGPGNIAGTVRFERDTPRFDQFDMRGTAVGTYGNVGRNDQMLDATAGMKEGYVRATGTHSASDDYMDGAGNKVRSAYWRRSVTGAVGWTPDANTLIEASADVSEGQGNYADRSMDAAALDRQSVKLRFSKEAVTPLLAKLSAEAYYNYIDHIMDNYTLRDASSMDMGMNVDRRTLGGRAAVDLAVTAQTLLKVGTDYHNDQHSSRMLSSADLMAGLEYSDKDRVTDMEFNVGGLYAQLEHAFTPQSRLLAGLRGDFVQVEHHVTGRDDTNLLFSGFVRYEHDVDIGLPLTAYAGFGHVERSADWWERYYTFDVNPETVNQVDLGAIVHGQKWRGSLGAFHAAYDDYILRDTTSGTTVSRNIEARVTGFELDASYTVTPSLKLNGSLVYAYGDNLTDGLPLAQMPPLEFRANLQYDDGTYVAGLVFRAATEQDRVAVGQGNIIGTDTGATDGFVTFGLNAGWRPTPTVLLLAGVDNLFDAEYSEHVSKGVDPTLALLGYDTNSVRINEPGRTFWLRAKVTF